MDIFDICDENKRQIIFVDSDTRSFVTLTDQTLMEIWFEKQPGLNEFECETSKSVEPFPAMDAIMEGESFYATYINALIDKQLENCKKSGEHGKNKNKNEQCNFCGYHVKD